MTNPLVGAGMRRARRLGCLGIIAVGVAGIVVQPAHAAEPASALAQHSESDGGARDELAPVAADALEHLDGFVRTGMLPELWKYQARRTALANKIGERLSIAPQRLVAAWDRADLAHQLALMAALSQLGTPYAKNTSTPGVGFDCSGLTTYAWAAAGTDIARNSAAQIRAADDRTEDTATAGDLVHYPGHIMMYLGVDRAIVHAIEPGRPVEVDVVSERRQITFGSPA